MKKPPFVENQIYHIYNRGVEKRNIFMDTADHARFARNLFECNDTKSIKAVNRKISSQEEMFQVGLGTRESFSIPSVTQRDVLFDEM